MRWCLFTAVCCAMVVGADGQIYNFAVTSRPETLSDGTEVVVNQLAIDFAGAYTGSQLLIELDVGEIINVPLFGAQQNMPPSTGAVGFMPDLAFDTFVSNGGFRSEDEPLGAASLGGSAINLDPAQGPTAVFNDPARISQFYFPRHGSLPESETNFAVAQLTFTKDAQGSFAYLGSAETIFFITRENNDWRNDDLFYIENGAIVPIPEPGTLLAAGACVIGLRPRVLRCV